MVQKEFNQIVEEQISIIKNLITNKGSEYANTDVLSNFKQGAGFFENGTPEKTLYSYLVKHLVSIKNHCEGSIPLNSDKLKEKCLDNIVYSILLLAIQIEKENDQDTLHQLPK